jgi:hypothetical protein
MPSKKMKRIQKITRVQLKINQENELFLLAIVSAEPDYKLCLLINKKFHILLKNISPVNITAGNGSEVLFSRFSDINGSQGIIYTLVSNRSDKYFLLKKLKNVDYIFLVHNSENVSDIDRISSAMREIESVNAVFIIDIKSLKDKNLQYLIH